MIGICGASGYVGWELFRYLKGRHENVMGTYCRNRKNGLVRYDLREDPFSIFDQCSYVIVAAAYAKIKFCEKNQLEAFWLNVYRTRELLQYLNDKGIPALFISTDIAENPNTIYGKYKLRVERFIKKEGLKSAYIRPGKIHKDNIRGLCDEIYENIKSRRRQKVTAGRS